MDDLNSQEPKPAGFPSADRPTPPPPPPPEITIRTMKSDLESLRQSGGANPAPKPFTPPELKKEWVSPPPPPPPPPPLPPAFPKNPAEEKVSVVEEESSAETSGALKKILVWAGFGVIVLGVGALGYFVVFPLLFPPTTSFPPPPAVTAPPTTEAPITDVPKAETPLVLQTHQSFLQSSDASSPASLATIDFSALTAALQQEAGKSLPPGSLSEIILSDINGQIPASKTFSALLPEFSETEIQNFFEEDFTAGLYYDADGAWPIYILKLKLDANFSEAQASVNKLEQSLNLGNLFLTPPGAPNPAGFTTGQANSVPTRYLTYSKRGAALNFAWSNDKLLISASYNGLKKVLTSL